MTDWGTEIDMSFRHAPVAARRRGAVVAAALFALGALACGGDDDDDDTGTQPDAGTVESAVPGATVDLALGEEVYQTSCAQCHGEDLGGTDQGPSQLSIVYEPNHHSDEAYVAAIAQGSPEHHWEFGDMPPVEGLDDDEVASVIAYIRSVQETEGFER
jgi:mono/diheme cytochrome c family protein